MSEQEELSLLMHWEGCVHLIFDLCQKMPRRVRFSFVRRLEDLALNVMLKLTAARYQRGDTRLSSLQDVDQALAQLRVLVRLAHARKDLLSHKELERVSQALDEAGRMVGGWLKHERRV